MQYGFNHTLKFFFVSVGMLVSLSAQAVNVQNAAGGVNEAAMTTALGGAGVNITNLTITNPGSCANFRRGVGRFTNGNTGGAGPVLSEPTGVVVASGDFANVANPLDSSNNVGNAGVRLCTGATSDADMVTLLASTANGEYAAIEFDVVPNFSTMAIPFQFASEEFPEYVCSAFTDIVGIFVAGPGITSSAPTFSNAPGTNGGPTSVYENYAKTSTGNLSSINWVNTGVAGTQATNACVDAVGGGSLANGAFYTDNSNGNTTGGNATVALTNTNIELDGFTNTLFQPITVVPGQIYHVKIAVADAQDRDYDSAAFIHPIFSTGTFSGFDYGDAPDTYGTLTSSAGPKHGVDTSIFMGNVPDNEITGIPSVGADGDDLNNTNDEDGIASFPVLLGDATAYSVNVNVTNNSGSNGTLVGWIDFDGNGTFETTEGVQTIVPTGTTGGTAALSWTGLSGLVAGSTYARFRFSSDIALSTLTTGSNMSDGEVEDYALEISGVTFTKYVSTDAMCTDAIQAVSVSVGTTVYYCYTITNPNTSPFTVTATADDQGIDFSGLEVVYAAGASNTVIVPVIAGSAILPAGVTTVNVADTTVNIGGSSVVASDTASVTVSLTLPASGVKQLYFDAVTANPANLTRDPTNALVDTLSANITGGSTFTLNQGIVFEGPFTLTGGNNVVVQLRVRRRNGGGARTIQAELFNVNGGAPIGATGSTISWNAFGWQTVQVLVNIPADTNLVATDAIRVVLTNTSANNRNIQLRTLEGAIKSQLQIQTSTVINVDSIVPYAATHPSTLKFSSYEPTETVFIRAVISDPFGSADITSANITITDSAAGTPVNNQAMILVPAATTALTKTFEYMYDLTSGAAPVGLWNVSVTANEGFEASILHTVNSTLVVGTPALTVTKTNTIVYDPINASNYKALPGAIVEYTIDVDNSDFGYVDDNTFSISDPIPAGSTLFFGQNPPVPFVLSPIDFANGDTLGGDSSGLMFTLNLGDLSDATDDVEFYNTGGTILVTPTYDPVTGYDTTSPPIDLIVINPKGEFNGSDGTTNPSLQIKFRVKLD